MAAEFMQKYWRTPPPLLLLQWRCGRVVDCVGLENRSAARYRGFESLRLRPVRQPHKMARSTSLWAFLLRWRAALTCPGQLIPSPFSSLKMTRTQFLRLLPIGAALGTWPTWAPSRPAQATPYQHAVSRWCYQFLPLEALCEACQELGIAGIDLTSAADWPTLRRYGLSPVTGMDSTFISLTEGFNDPAFAAAYTPAYLRFIEQAAEAGVPFVIVFTGNRKGRDDQTSLDVMARGLTPLVKRAEQLGVTLITETLNSKVDHPDYQGDHTRYLIRLCDKVGSERLKILYDIYHMQIMEGDIIRTIRDHHAYFAHYHTAGVPGRHEIDAHQELNYPAIMRAIADTGFSGFVAQEFVPTGRTRADQLAALGEAVRICSL